MKMFILLILLSGNVNAGVYKCKNITGNTTYSESPCTEKSKTENFTIKKDSDQTIAKRKLAVKNRADNKASLLQSEKDKKKLSLKGQDSKIRDLNDRRAKLEKSLRKNQASLKTLSKQVSKRRKSVKKISNDKKR